MFTFSTKTQKPVRANKLELQKINISSIEELCDTGIGSRFSIQDAKKTIIFWVEKLIQRQSNY